MEQHQLEGGLCGRTNKLVDACYSFWVGGVFTMVEPIIHGNNITSLFSRLGLKNYILRCCQSASGGFKDKPGKSVDFYHTNYTLCGLSICEHELKFDDSTQKLSYSFAPQTVVESPFTKPINPVFGLPLDVGEATHQHFLYADKH
jgi:protein farnesyltransferase subunit beta